MFEIDWEAVEAIKKYEYIPEEGTLWDALALLGSVVLFTLVMLVIAYYFY